MELGCVVKDVRNHLVTHLTVLVPLVIPDIFRIGYIVAEVLAVLEELLYIAEVLFRCLLRHSVLRERLYEP